MKRYLASALWFLAASAVYDALALLLALPRDVGPVVALSVAVGVFAVLRTARREPGHPDVSAALVTPIPNR